MERDDKEAFEIIPVRKAEIRDLDFCSDSAKVLSACVKKITRGTITIIERRMLLLLLRDLCCFIMGQEHQQWADPMTLPGRPDKERQKTMREQEILKELFNTLKVSTDGQRLAAAVAVSGCAGARGRRSATTDCSSGVCDGIASSTRPPPARACLGWWD